MSDKSLRVGTAQQDITPDLPVERGGSFTSFEATEVLAPLMAQSVALEKEGETAIWTNCDVSNLEMPLVKLYRTLVSEGTGLPVDRIHVSTTHTHGGPSGPRFSIYRDEVVYKQVKQTYETIVGKAAKTAIAAYGNMKPVRMGYGRGRAERACFNRRFIMSNGRACNMNIRMFLDSQSDGGIIPLKIEGPVDDEVQVIWFEDCETGDIAAVMVNFASHPSKMARMKKLGPEYPGEMRAAVRRALGREVPVLFLQGACGNINTNDMENDPYWGTGEEGIRTTGYHLAGEVIKLLHASRAVSTEGMVFAQRRKILNLPYRSFPEDEAARTLQIIREGQSRPDRIEYFGKHFDSLEERARARAIAFIDHLKQQGNSDAVELMGMRLGDVVFIGTPVHQFVEFQIALKKVFPGKPVILADFTNGALNYVPTPVAIALGGYETEHRRYEADAGEKILEANISLVRELYSL